jgi:hypothetical protein
MFDEVERVKIHKTVTMRRLGVSHLGVNGLFPKIWDRLVRVVPLHNTAPKVCGGIVWSLFTFI